MRNKHVLFAVLLTYLVVSFVPSIALPNIMGKGQEGLIMGDSAGKWLVLLGYSAVLLVLVRPGSQGPGFVSAVGSAMSNLVSASTGGSAANFG